MQPVIGCDAHKHFSVFVSVDQHGSLHDPCASIMTRSLLQLSAQLAGRQRNCSGGTGHWYWIVDAMEERHHPTWPTHLRQARMAEQQDRCARRQGLAILLRCGTLQRAGFHRRTARPARAAAHSHGAARSAHFAQAPHPRGIDRYGLQADAISDLFGTKGASILPASQSFANGDCAHDRAATEFIDQLEEKITAIELRIAEQLKASRRYDCYAQFRSRADPRSASLA